MKHRVHPVSKYRELFQICNYGHHNFQIRNSSTYVYFFVQKCLEWACARVMNISGVK